MDFNDDEVCMERLRKIWQLSFEGKINEIKNETEELLQEFYIWQQQQQGLTAPQTIEAAVPPNEKWSQKFYNQKVDTWSDIVFALIQLIQEKEEVKS